MDKLLIVDDDLVFCKALTLTLEAKGYHVKTAHTLDKGRVLLKQHSFSVAFIDVYLPDGNGLDLLPELALLPFPPEPVVVTALGDEGGAELAITSGAWDYIQKPPVMADVVRMVEQACSVHEKKQHRLRIAQATGIVGESPPVRYMLAQMLEAAQSDSPVLITGETGTGKELMARAIHKNSPRAKGPFVVVDCGAISPTLMESELFGNIRGAFTGAAQTRHGLVMLANNGTLFLDEIGELTLEQQKVFLRVLQERSFRPVGSTEEVPSDFRVVAATNKDLVAMAEQGQFRPDLLFRLQGSVINLPALRVRGEDIQTLARYALEQCCAKYGGKAQMFSTEAMEAFSRYPWPGNVRELLHAVERAAMAAKEEPLVLLQHLPLQLRTSTARSRLKKRVRSTASEGELSPLAEIKGAEGRLFTGENTLGQGGGGFTVEQAAPFLGVVAQTAPISWPQFQKEVLFQQKHKYLTEQLQWAGGDITLAAKIAKVSRQRLYTLLREHSIARQWSGLGETP